MAEDVLVVHLSHAVHIAVHHKLCPSWRKGPLLILQTNVQDSQNLCIITSRGAESTNQ